MEENHVEIIRDAASGRLVKVVGTLKTLVTDTSVEGTDLAAETTAYAGQVTTQGVCTYTSYASYPYVGWAGDWYAEAYAYQEVSSGCTSSTVWSTKLREDQGFWLPVRDSASGSTYPGERDDIHLMFECATSANEDWEHEVDMTPYQPNHWQNIACND